MLNTGIPILGTFNTPRLTAAGGTAFLGLIQPWRGPAGGAPYLYKATSLTNANWLTQAPHYGLTKITSILCLAGSTAHTFYVVRPRNWTYFPSGLAKNTTAIPDSVTTGIATDPGAYSTGYGYATCGSNYPGPVANNTIAANDYVAFQLADGSWQLSKIASGTFGSSLTLSTGTPNRDGGAIPTGGVMFFFGAATGGETDPANGLSDAGFDTIVSVRNDWQDSVAGLVTGLHPGDPLLIFNANGTAADTIIASGYYSQV